MKTERRFAGARPLAVLVHQYRAPRFGKVAIVDGGGASKGGTCEAAHLDSALMNIADVRRAPCGPSPECIKERFPGQPDDGTVKLLQLVAGNRVAQHWLELLCG